MVNKVYFVQNEICTEDFPFRLCWVLSESSKHMTALFSLACKIFYENVLSWLNTNKIWVLALKLLLKNVNITFLCFRSLELWFNREFWNSAGLCMFWVSWVVTWTLWQCNVPFASLSSAAPSAQKNLPAFILSLFCLEEGADIHRLVPHSITVETWERCSDARANSKALCYVKH